MKGSLKHAALAFAVVTLAGACNTDRDRAAETGADTAQTTAAGTVAQEYRDENIFATLHTANNGEIEGGNAAATKASNADVKAFARQIAADHRAMDKEITTLEQKLNLVLPSPTDQEILDDHRKAMEDLSDETGQNFDEKFLEHEVNMHDKVLDEIDDALKNTQNAEIRDLLTKARAGIEGHLNRAKELKDRVG